MKKYKTKYRNQHPKFKAWKPVIILSLILIAISAGFRGYAIAGNVQNYAKTLEGKVITTARANTELLGQNQTLEQQLLDKQLTFSSHIGTPQYIKDSVTSYIHLYFPKSQWSNAVKVSTCESNMNNQALNNRNTNGSIDYGSFQINSTHEKQFKDMFGVSLSTGGFDIDHNVKFAAWLYQNSGNWSAWVCSKVL